MGIIWRTIGASDWSNNLFDTCIDIFAGSTFLYCSDLTLLIEGDFQNKQWQENVELCLILRNEIKLYTLK